MREISPGVYLETDQRGANYGGILTDDGIIVIDTPIVPKQAQAFREELRRLAEGKPFLYVINTDHHRGHILGNQFFFPTPVVAHDQAWKHMKGYGDNFRQRVIDSFKKEPEVQAQFTDVQIVIPKITYSHRLDIIRGGRDIRLIRIGGHTFHDLHPYGLLTFGQVLERSSNVGAAKLGMRLGQERLHSALLRFGFGARTGIDLPAEIVGLVRDWQSWSGLSIGAISFGQEVGVTSIQMITAINVIASGGYRVRPHLVERLIDSNGELVRVSETTRTRVVAPETAAVVSSAFEGVVLRGTAKGAALEGYRAAGKTGTAQKIVNGQYSSEKYLSSFIGYAPLPNPRVTILVQIDEPKGAIYGGKVAAPVFQQIAQQVLVHLRIPPDRTLPLPRPDPMQLASDNQDYLPGATPVQPITAAEANTSAGTDGSAIVVRVAERPVEMPDFLGLSKRKVIAGCQELGIRMQATGAGIAVQQYPGAGTIVSAGATCSITFARGSSGKLQRVMGTAGSQLAQSAQGENQPASHP